MFFFQLLCCVTVQCCVNNKYPKKQLYFLALYTMYCNYCIGPLIVNTDQSRPTIKNECDVTNESDVANECDVTDVHLSSKPGYLDWYILINFHYSVFATFPYYYKSNGSCISSVCFHFERLGLGLTAENIVKDVFIKVGHSKPT